MTMSEKRKRFVKTVCDELDIIDRSGVNSQRFREKMDSLSDTAFHKAMEDLANGKWQLRVEMPNFINKFNTDDLLLVAQRVGAKIFHRLKFTDESTGMKYLSPIPYPVLLLPVARTQQTIEKKLSTQSADKQIDALTGQKVGSDKGAGISNPEIQALYTRGRTQVLKELVAIRGGNVPAYGEFRSFLESSGEVSLNQLDPFSRTRASVVLQQLLLGMHLDSNLVE